MKQKCFLCPLEDYEGDDRFWECRTQEDRMARTIWLALTMSVLMFSCLCVVTRPLWCGSL